MTFKEAEVDVASPLAAIRRNIRDLRREALRIGAEAVVFGSAYAARRKLAKSGALRVLIDSSVLAHGISHETAWISTGTSKWGDIDIPTGYAARVPVHSPQNDSRLYREVQYLPGLVQLAKWGCLQLFSSAELGAERFRQPVGRFQGYGYYDLNLFADVRLESIDGFHLDLFDPKTAQQERLRRNDDFLFRALVEQLGSKSNQDAHHIFTSERCGMFCFLHIDFPLAAKVKQHAKQVPFCDLKTLVLTPSELGNRLGVLPVSTNILSYRGSSFPVHPELHWAEEHRRRPKRDKDL